MPQIAGKQLKDGAVDTTQLADGALSADSSGRAKVATDFFDATAINDKVADDALDSSFMQDKIGADAFTATAVANAFATGAFTNAAVDDIFVDGAVGSAKLVIEGDVAWGSNKITGLANGSDAGDAVNKGQLDAAISGLEWQSPADVMGLVGNAAASTIEGLSPTAGDAYVVTTADGSGELATATIGDIWEYSGSAWVKILTGVGGFVPANARAVLSTQTALIAPYTDATDDGKIADFSGSSNTGTLTTSLDGWAILCKGENSYYENKGYAFDGTVPTGAWVQMSGPYPYAPVGDITTIECDDSAAAGTSANLARGDHQHAIVCATPSSVGTANSEGSATSFARSDHVHDSPGPTTGDKALTPTNNCTVDDADSGLDIAATPALDSYVRVLVNGLGAELGDGVKTKDCYFSGDGGTTARAISAITAADSFYWNAVIAGYSLVNDGSDEVDFDYLV